MTGKIIKGIGGFYYVHTEQGLYECRAKGIFRKNKIKPLVGDDVGIQVLDEQGKIGNIDEILPRKNQLIRPAVANVDQAVVIFALSDPEPNLNLLDRFLVMMEWQEVPTVICFNKMDIVSEKICNKMLSVYERCTNQVLAISSKEQIGLDKLRAVLHKKTSVLAGPSGVGKSSSLNLIYPEAQMETGAVSEKIRRGKHTTRHSELFSVDDQTFLMDTPGFSSLLLPELEKEDLRFYFSEFSKYEGQCKFQGCVHVHEPGCAVQAALESGEIHESRYRNYLQMYEELKERKKY